MTMNPNWSANEAISVPLYMAGPSPPHQCAATRMGAPAGALAGTYSYIRMLLGLKPKFVTSVNVAAAAGGASATTATAPATARLAVAMAASTLTRLLMGANSRVYGVLAHVAVGFALALVQLPRKPNV